MSSTISIDGSSWYSDSFDIESLNVLLFIYIWLRCSGFLICLLISFQKAVYFSTTGISTGSLQIAGKKPLTSFICLSDRAGGMFSNITFWSSLSKADESPCYLSNSFKLLSCKPSSFFRSSPSFKTITLLSACILKNCLSILVVLNLMKALMSLKLKIRLMSNSLASCARALN